MSLKLSPYGPEDAAKIGTDLDAWAKYMGELRQPVPDFWSELNTSERLGEWLAALGYRKADSLAPKLLATLAKVRDHFLFTDDDGSIGVSDAIDADLFADICTAINAAKAVQS